MHGFDVWSVLFTDGKVTTHETAEWSEIAAPQQFGEHTYYVTTRPVRSLTVHVEDQQFVLDAQAPTFSGEAYAFRIYHSRVGADGVDQLIRYEFGFVYPTLNVLLRGMADLDTQLITSDYLRLDGSPRSF